MPLSFSIPHAKETQLANKTKSLKHLGCTYTILSFPHGTWRLQQYSNKIAAMTIVKQFSSFHYFSFAKTPNRPPLGIAHFAAAIVLRGWRDRGGKGGGNRESLPHTLNSPTTRKKNPRDIFFRSDKYLHTHLKKVVLSFYFSSRGTFWYTIKVSEPSLAKFSSLFIVFVHFLIISLLWFRFAGMRCVSSSVFTAPRPSSSSRRPGWRDKTLFVSKKEKKNLLKLGNLIFRWAKT